eukprot:TRINITY_DN10023_c0_g1_i1.p1 TRINITY_DN10023_c0_g1~~TRINITY_DN10023_c0_g1_i1.p1  ORF type:complete len:375 (-),score=65.57 TRINITY_DN10023_c0_g1_i1:34-1158(-)
MTQFQRRYNMTSSCRPRYGACVNGVRQIPILALDVAGLVPGAHSGKGLGNKFLHDLSTADILLHVIDASGTVDENGKETEGYDPTRDIAWLIEEIEMWIYTNLMEKWVSVVRRHTTTRGVVVETLHGQLSGYSTQLITVQNTLDSLHLQEPLDKIENWDPQMVRKFVNAFVAERFPIILALNKIDMKDSAKNISRICSRYGEDRVVLVCSLAECFLRQMRTKNYIYYNEGDDDFVMYGEEIPTDKKYVITGPLVKPPEKAAQSLQKLRNMVLFRYGSTGCVDVINSIIKERKFFPVYLVDSTTKFTAFDSTDKADGVFRDVALIPQGYTLRQIAKVFDLPGTVLFGHGVDGIQMGPDQPVSPTNNILKITIKDY